MKPIKLTLSRSDAEQLLALLKTSASFPDVVEELETALVAAVPPKGYKVWGWTGRRNEAGGDGNWHAQTREICAARSKAEVYRIVGLKPSQVGELIETGNEGELRMALRNLGVVFWKRLNDWSDRADVWHRVC